jgi:hypothetical protein
LLISENNELDLKIILTNVPILLVVKGVDPVKSYLPLDLLNALASRGFFLASASISESKLSPAKTLISSRSSSSLYSLAVKADRFFSFFDSLFSTNSRLASSLLMGALLKVKACLVGPLSD